VKKSLQDALYATYPPIFRQRDFPVADSGMGRGIECCDGWYAILDGLCQVLSNHADQIGHLPIEAKQVKQKFGSLRFYTDRTCDKCYGAIDFARILSLHVCEQTGRPGTLMVQLPPGRWVRTLSDEVGRADAIRAG
jgi:hypothetical protein